MGVLYQLHHLQGIVKLDVVFIDVLFEGLLVVGIELEELLHAGNFLLLLADVIDVVEVADFKLQRVGYISVAGAVR